VEPNLCECLDGFEHDEETQSICVPVGEIVEEVISKVEKSYVEGALTKATEVEEPKEEEGASINTLYAIIIAFICTLLLGGITLKYISHRISRRRRRRNPSRAEIVPLQTKDAEVKPGKGIAKS
jgi:hypothetical protein